MTWWLQTITSKVKETTFTTPRFTNKLATSTSLREKRERVEQDKLAVLYRHLDVKWGLNLVDLNQF